MENSGVINGRRKGISNWMRQFKTIIDTKKMLFKEEEGLFGIFKWGEFRPLPVIDYVLVFRQFFTKCETCTFDENDVDNTSYFQVSLVYKKNRRIIVHETRSKQEAFGMATNLSQSFLVPIRDSATRRGESSWVKKILV